MAIDTTVTSSGTFSVSNAITGKLGTVTGANTLTKAGEGTLAIASAIDNSASASGITVSAGTLSAAAAQNLPVLTTLNGGILALANGVTTEREIAVAANSSVNVASGASATLGGAAAMLTGGRTLTKTGAGTLALSGNKADATTAFTVQAGTLSIGDPLQLPAGGSPALTLAGGTLATTAVLSLPLAITLTGNSTLDTGANAVTQANAITGAFALTKAGSGTLTLAADNSAAASTLNVNVGTVSISAANQLPGASLTLSGGQLTVNGGAPITIAQQAIDLSANSAIRTVSPTVISSALTETGERTLTKSGAESLEISSDISTFTGIAVTEGTLVATDGDYLPVTTTLNGATAVLSLANGVTSARTIAIGADGASIDVDAGEAILGGGEGSLTGANTLTKTGAGTLRISGDKSASQTNIYVTAGILKADAGENFPASVEIDSAATLLTAGEIPALGGRTITMYSGSILNLGGNFAAAITIA